MYIYSVCVYFSILCTHTAIVHVQNSAYSLYMFTLSTVMFTLSAVMVTLSAVYHVLFDKHVKINCLITFCIISNPLGHRPEMETVNCNNLLLSYLFQEECRIILNCHGHSSQTNKKLQSTMK